MSQKLPVNGFKWRKDLLRFDEEFIESYGEDSDKRYNIEVDADYPKELQEEHSVLLFLTEKIKIGEC